jgi:hypothetical protein
VMKKPVRISVPSCICRKGARAMAAKPGFQLQVKKAGG